jgi:hypothetical protein
MLGVNSGLGYFVLNTRDRLAYADLMAAILVIGACGFCLDGAARWLFRERHRNARLASRQDATARQGGALRQPTGVAGGDAALIESEPAHVV